MNPEIKDMWVDALTSGEYKQGQNVLQCSNGEFCCLGVLCDLYMKATGNGQWVIDYSWGHKFVTGTQEDSCAPTPDVMEWAGLEVLPSYDKDTHLGQLICKNDSGVPFTAIAEYIEENL